MYRVLIVEDMPAEAEVLKRHLSRYGVEHDLRFDVRVIASALAFVDDRPSADLIFMDIDLPGMTGMEAAEHLRAYDESTPLIFVTNLAQFAVQGYAVDALDFVVKPVEYHDFALRMDRAVRVMERLEGRTVSIKSEGEVHIVSQADIVYVDVVKHNVRYHMAKGSGEPVGQEVLCERGTLRAAEQELNQALFLRINSGCLVNMGQVRRITPSSVVMQTGEELFFSRSQRKPALEKLANYAGRSI